MVQTRLKGATPSQHIRFSADAVTRLQSTAATTS